MGKIQLHVLWTKKEVVFASEDKYEVTEFKKRYEKEHPGTQYFVSLVNIDLNSSERELLLKGDHGDIFATTIDAVRNRMFPTQID